VPILCAVPLTGAANAPILIVNGEYESLTVAGFDTCASCQSSLSFLATGYCDEKFVIFHQHHHRLLDQTVKHQTVWGHDFDRLARGYGHHAYAFGAWVP